MLSAYDAASHAYWREGLYQAFPEWEWQTLALPPRHFSWRIRGNPISWYSEEALRRDYDLVIATSMVDLATLKGLHPQLAQLPCWLYFHENQFAYPDSVSRKKAHVIEPQMVQVYSALAAECCIFNSAYNRDSFFAGAASLLERFPDKVPGGIFEQLQQIKGQSAIIPVCLNNLDEYVVANHRVNCTDHVKDSGHVYAPGRVYDIVWNHRWEYDKGPERLLALLEKLDPRLTLRCHIVGESFRHVPPVFEQIKALLHARGWLGQWGFLESRDDYLEVLASSDIVLSTSEHDFQGLSVLEGIAHGCIPLLPNRLVYPAYVDEVFLYPSDKNIEEEAKAAAHCLSTQLVNLPAMRDALPSLKHFSLESCRKAYRELLIS